MSHYVYSTLASDQIYRELGRNRQVVAEVFIAGKANIPNKHMLTARGVSTEVTDEQLAVLHSNKLFQLHVSNGFLTVEPRNRDAEKVARDMNPADPSAPDTEAKLSTANRRVPKTNKRGA